MMLEITWILLSIIHVIPLAGYILYMNHIFKNNNWNINFNVLYKPHVTLIIPTYNESSVIINKLENIKQIDYPVDKIDYIIIDSASTDDTYEKAFNWAKEKENVTLLSENERRGKSHALNIALASAKGEIVGISDAEATLASDSVSEAIKYLVDESVGAVTGSHSIHALHDSEAVKAEKTYRNIYQILNVGASKLHSTPIFEGELAFFKRNLIDSFPEDVGADDVGAALEMIDRGYRVLAVPDSIFYEPTPYTWKERFKQKIRRAQHVIQAFLKYRKLLFSDNTAFHKLVFPMNFYIYLINPIIGNILIVLSILLALKYTYLIGFSLLLVFPTIRNIIFTHISNLIIIFLAYLNEIRGDKQIVWDKISETRYKV